MVDLNKELYCWISEHDGKVPCMYDMKVKDGFPSFYQYQKVFGLPKWNDILHVLLAESITLVRGPPLPEASTVKERLLVTRWKKAIKWRMSLDYKK